MTIGEGEKEQEKERRKRRRKRGRKERRRGREGEGEGGGGSYRPDVMVKGGLDELLVLEENALELTATLAHVAKNTASQADVGIGIDEELLGQEVSG